MSSTQRITPVLVYSDIDAAHRFLIEAFGFEAGALERTDEGEVVHGEVHAGNETIWLHRVSAEHGLVPETNDAGGLAVLVDDVDSHYDRARKAGATIDSAPQDQPYGRREYGARDPEGHRWWFGTLISAEPPKGPVRGGLP